MIGPCVWWNAQCTCIFYFMASGKMQVLMFCTRRSCKYMNVQCIRLVVLPMCEHWKRWLQDQLWVVCLGQFKPNFHRQATGFLTNWRATLASAQVLFDPVLRCDASLVRMRLSRIYRQAWTTAAVILERASSVWLPSVEHTHGYTSYTSCGSAFLGSIGRGVVAGPAMGRVSGTVWAKFSSASSRVHDKLKG